MPETYQYQVELIAGVVRVEKKENNYLISVNIIEIDEDARESIVKVVFKKQRKGIRLNKTD